MTESSRHPGRPRARTVLWSSLAVFLVVLTFLAWQLRTGRDPALGAGTQAPAPAKRHVLVRRIHKRVIVTHVLPPRASAAPAIGRQAASAPAAPAVTRAAPAPAASPAPAPAPAPVTKSS